MGCQQEFEETAARAHLELHQQVILCRAAVHPQDGHRNSRFGLDGVQHIVRLKRHALKHGSCNVMLASAS